MGNIGRTSCRCHETLQSSQFPGSKALAIKPNGLDIALCSTDISGEVVRDGDPSASFAKTKIRNMNKVVDLGQLRIIIKKFHLDADSNYSNLLKIDYSIEITRYSKKPLKHIITMMIIEQNSKHKFRHHLHEFG